MTKTRPSRAFSASTATPSATVTAGSHDMGPMLKPLAWATIMLCSALSAQAQQAPAASTQLERVEVVGTTPLSGPGLRKNQIAAPVQTATDEDLNRSGSLDLSDYLNRRLGSVHVNTMQGNPLQMDVNYRGYTASPLLGTPQGISVYMDGVRLNQPFGDVVSWDLIPKSAISTVSLMPGSNPLFGLNTLGGALSIQTKDGRSHPGTVMQATVGSHGLVTGELSVGGSNKSGWDVFATVSGLSDLGWRVNSKSDVVQGFLKLGYTDGPTRATLSVSGADSTLNGNGLQEQRFLDRDWSSVYTQPDNTTQKALLVNATLDHAISPTMKLTGNAFVRKISGTTLNADINEGALDQSVYQPSAADLTALRRAGYTGFPTSGATAANTPFPFWRCIAQALQKDEPAEKCNGLINTTSTSQTTVGVNAQLSMTGDLAGNRNLLVVGAGLESNRAAFRQNSQLGYLNADRTVTGVNAFGDGVNGGDVDGAPYDTRVDLQSRTQTASLLFSNTVSLGSTLHLTASGRYNRTTVKNRDQIRSAPDSSSLDGDHQFSRFNPALGVTWNPSSAFNAYAGYAQSSRAPTAIELGCANPDRPCKLPNAMAGDPPLKQVLTQTLELGARGRITDNTAWRAGVFRSVNKDDILFVADNQSGFGYFKNFGETRRQGLELGLDTRFEGVTLGLNYTLLDATFQSAETVLGGSNSSNDAGAGLEGNIDVKPGNRIPLIPRHILKASAGLAINSRWSVDVDVSALSGVYARGNENNQHEAGGVNYLGAGKTASYAIMNLGVAYRPDTALKFFMQINNLLDRRYTTGAQLGATGFNDAGNFVARPFPAVNGQFPLVHATFYAPGAPRSVSLGMRYEFDR